MPDYISTADTAARWGLKTRRVVTLCETGRIPGAYKVGTGWLIPANAEKPADARLKNAKKTTNGIVPQPAQSKPNENAHADMEKLSAPFRALIKKEGLNYQFYDLLPIPIQIFAPDGLCIFYNRACLELNGVPDANLVVGKYNYNDDPICKEIMGQDVYDRVSRGEVVSFPDFPAPIQGAVDRGVVIDKPYEAATMDLLFLPLWDGDTYVCSIMFCTVKNMYFGRADIAKAQEYIESHWFEDFDLDKAAGSINLSRHHFTRIFKEDSGDTPVRFYQKIKIKKIQEKLLDGNLNIEQAFAACGVEYRGAYLRLFKEIAGKTPTEFRKDNNLK